MVVSLFFLLFFFTTVPKIKSKPCPSLFSYNLQLWKNKQAGNLFLTGATGRVEGSEKRTCTAIFPTGSYPMLILGRFTLLRCCSPSPSESSPSLFIRSPIAADCFRAFTEMADSLGSSCDKSKTCTSSQDMKV